ncbi:MAG: hypothetical protein LBJ90_02635, partial [Treponema sp.]|nr:hypothetical protein [Treponema sp.]
MNSFIFFDDQPLLYEARRRRAGKAKAYKLINLNVFLLMCRTETLKPKGSASRMLPLRAPKPP